MNSTFFYYLGVNDIFILVISNIVPEILSRSMPKHFAFVLSCSEKYTAILIATSQTNASCRQQWSALQQTYSWSNSPSKAPYKWLAAYSLTLGTCLCHFVAKGSLENGHYKIKSCYYVRYILIFNYNVIAGCVNSNSSVMHSNIILHNLLLCMSLNIQGLVNAKHKC